MDKLKIYIVTLLKFPQKERKTAVSHLQHNLLLHLAHQQHSGLLLRVCDGGLAEGGAAVGSVCGHGWGGGSAHHHTATAHLYASAAGGG